MATTTALEPTADVESSGLPSDAPYEIIDGHVMEKPEMGTYPVEVASILLENLGPYARGAGIGRAIVEVLFRIDASNQYRPDVAFISHGKWPVQRRTPKRQPWEIVPDVAIEVISETDRAEEVLGKTHHYLKAGVRAVWLIYPSLEVIHIFDSITRIRVLTRGDTLEGGEIILGFQLPLELLFQGEAAEGDEAENPID
jgi:Uma2 family endonuclease